jgi:hypothetical protein
MSFSFFDKSFHCNVGVLNREVDPASHGWPGESLPVFRLARIGRLYWMANVSRERAISGPIVPRSRIF